jgi:hypothetical protein
LFARICQIFSEQEEVRHTLELGIILPKANLLWQAC